MFEYEQETYGSKGRRNKQHRITVTYAQIASGEVEVKW